MQALRSAPMSLSRLEVPRRRSKYRPAPFNSRPKTRRAQTVITDKLIQDLPTVVGGTLRSPFDLAILAPESKNFGDNNFQIGGGQAASFGVNLDGVSANTTRALSQLVGRREHAVPRCDHGVRGGNQRVQGRVRAAGGGSINFVSKSGTNDFHGLVYEYARNDAFDAREVLPGQEAGLQAARFRRHRRRSGLDSEDLQRPQQDVLLLLVRRRSATATARCPIVDGADAGDVQRRLPQLGGCSGKMIQIYDPFSLHNGVRATVPGQHHSEKPLRPAVCEGIAAYAPGPAGS